MYQQFIPVYCWVVFHGVDVPQFNNSSIVGVWGFFFSFTNRDKTALNTCVQVIDVDINFLFSGTVQFSHSVVSDSLWPRAPQHARRPYPSPTPGVHPNPCPLSRWCHPTLILCCPLLLPSIFPSIRVFSNESALCIRWPKYWGFSFNISPSNEHPGLISFRMDWLDLLAVQGTLKSLLQHHSSKASILWHSAFFIVQLSHPYITTGKTIALTRQIFVGKVMSLLFNMLSRLVITFLTKYPASYMISLIVQKGKLGIK